MIKMDAFNFITVRLGKDSINDINLICSSEVGIVSQSFNITVKCTQIPDNYAPSDYAFIWLGSDNNKGAPTRWKQGFKAVGKVTNIRRGASYNDTSETTLEIIYIFRESINRIDILRCAPNEYYWCSSFPLIGIDDHANQTIRLMSGAELSDIKAFFRALDKASDYFKEEIIKVQSGFEPYFDVYIPSPKDFPNTKNLSEIERRKETNKNNGGRQQIFYGAPGTGKSNKIKEEVDNLGEIHFRTTFHPDSDYSTFVGCYKPKSHKKNMLNGNGINETQLLSSFFDSNSPKYNRMNKARYLYEALVHTKDIRDLGLDAQMVADKLNAKGFTGCAYTTEATCMYNIFDWLKEDGYIVENKITYEFTPQAFLKAYTEAWKHQATGDPVYLIIEEINRGNCAQIFGDIFQLLDRDPQGFSRYEISPDSDIQDYIGSLGLSISGIVNSEGKDVSAEIASGEILKLPDNLYIWATMNTSDQSLFPIDSAFKRRWEWKYIKIKEGKDGNGNKLDWKVDVKMDESGTLLSWWDFIKKINEIIASMTSSADKQLGYFFCCAKDGVIDEETFVSKVIFYLWNDVFKDYGFEDASLFRYTTKDEDGKEMEKDLTFPDFYDEDGEKVNTERLTDFVKKVMSWKKTNAEQD